MDALQSLSADVWRSYRSLPMWVQVWVTWLVGINVASVGQLDHPSGRATARGLVVWLLPNAVFLVTIRGLGKVHALSHVLVFPVVVASLIRRLGADDASASERRFAGLVVVTNAISMAFDILDAAAWLRGDRATAGVPSA